MLSSISEIISLISELFSLIGELRKYMAKQDIIKFVRDTTDVVKNTKGAKTAEDKQKAAQAISDLIKRL